MMSFGQVLLCSAQQACLERQHLLLDLQSEA
jgi:hypothetical protein